MTPNVNLDFLSGTLDSRISFSRSTSAINPATYINSSGLITMATNDQPRFDYDPITLACKGLLIEESRLNGLIFSNDFSTWSFVGGAGSSASITANYAISPDGTTNASRVVLVNANNFSLITKPFPAVIGNTYQFSLWFKSTSGSSQSATLAANGATGQQTITVTSTWTRLHVSLVATATLVRLQLLGGSGTTDVLVYEAQVELGLSVTSNIPTTSVQLLRNADVAVITGSNFTGFWNSVRGGATVQALPSTVSGIAPLVQFDDGTANEIIALRGNTTNPELYIVDGGTPQAQLDAGTIAANTAYSLTGWWSTNDCRARKDSGAAVTDATATIPTVTQARIGSDGTNYLNGTIAIINYYAAFSSQIYTRRKNKVVSSLF